MLEFELKQNRIIQTGLVLTGYSRYATLIQEFVSKNNINRYSVSCTECMDQREDSVNPSQPPLPCFILG
jgi:hypothetical protein